MNTKDLQTMGLTEMNEADMQSVDGGCSQFMRYEDMESTSKLAMHVYEYAAGVICGFFNI